MKRWRASRVEPAVDDDNDSGKSSKFGWSLFSKKEKWGISLSDAEKGAISRRYNDTAQIAYKEIADMCALMKATHHDALAHGYLVFGRRGSRLHSLNGNTAIYIDQQHVTTHQSRSRRLSTFSDEAPSSSLLFTNPHRKSVNGADTLFHEARIALGPLQRARAMSPEQSRTFLCGPKFVKFLSISCLLVNPSLVESRRFYAKGRDKPKSKKTVVTINEEEIREFINYDEFKIQMEREVTLMKEEFTKQLNVRGQAGALETLPVEFEGETYPLQELAQVGRKNPQMAILQLSSLPEALQPVLNALNSSGMNLNPQQEGTTIYVPMPKVTREHRESLAKNAKAIFVKYKTAMQTVQNRHIKKCRSQRDMSEDLLFSVQQQIMKVTENYVVEAEKVLNAKQNELLDNK